MKSRKVVPLALALVLGVTAALISPAIANPPNTYNADSTTNVYAKPSVTDSGLFDLNLAHCPTHGAGYIFTPTDFYCPILRVTDPNIDPNHIGKSYFGPPTWMCQGWNADSSHFYIQNDGGATFVYSFNATTMAATQLSGTYTGLSDWDGVNPNYAYGKLGTKITKWDFSTNPATTSTVVDAATYISGITSIYESHPSQGLGHGGTKAIAFAAVAGTGGQGDDYQVLYYNTATNTGYIYNTLAGTMTTTSGVNVPITVPATYKIHQISITRDGRYVWLTEQANSLVGTPGPYIWDTIAKTIVSENGFTSGGHQALGFAELVNSVVAHPNTYWWYRQIDTVAHIDSPVGLVASVPTLKGYDDHACWNQCQNGNVNSDWLPFFTSTIQTTGANGGVYNQNPPYWGDELLAVCTKVRNGTGTNTVYRFAHHRSTTIAHASVDDYSANAWPNVSQDGLWAMFQSNWEETLGTSPGSAGYFRDDVFIVKLTQSAH